MKDFEYLVLRKVKTGRTHKRFMDVEKEDVQVADMTEEDRYGEMDADGSRE